MQNTKDPWFVLERSEALASWLLTSRKDVRVKSEQKRDDGVDLLVEIDLGDRSFPNLFVVIVKGVMNPDLNSWEGTLRQQFANGSMSLPACLFLVNVKTNEAHYSWIAEPVMADNAVELRFDTDGDFHLLNLEAVNEIVDRVRNWYKHLPKQLQQKSH
jgi:hypothetical protein